jgi:hypothetical protein
LGAYESAGRWRPAGIGLCAGRVQEAAQALLHGLLWHIADQASGLGAVLEQDHGGDAEDAVAHGQLLVLVRVDLGDGDLLGMRLAEALDHG